MATITAVRKNREAKRKKVKRPKKRAKKLPRKLLFIPSSDKNFIEKWSDTANRDPLDIPKSFRQCLIGKPGVGKTLFLKNEILRIQQSKKPFERIIVMHQDQYAREYDDIDAEVITELPPNDFWMGYDEEDDEEEPDETPYRPSTLMIIDDICFGDLPKSQTNLLNRLCGFISSHCDVSLAVINQNFFEVHSVIRKCASVFVIWRPTDTDQLNTIARRVGWRAKDFKNLFDQVATKESDSIMVDMTPGTPYPLRKNGYEMIEKQRNGLL